jgi:dolichol-phosphate mannosyltransferase
MDADGSHSPDFIPKLWADGTRDLVIASATCPAVTETLPFLVFLSLIVNVVFRLSLGLRCADVSNSFRLFVGTICARSS